MSDRLYFFDVPIYRCSQAKHRLESISISKKRKDEYTNKLKTQGYELSQVPKSVNDTFQRIDKQEFYGWAYNDVIWWVRLYIWNGQIRGDGWGISKKRIVRKGRKLYSPYSKVFEMLIEPEDSSKKIFQKLLSQLKKLTEEPPFQKRLIDLSLLENVGKLFFPLEN